MIPKPCIHYDVQVEPIQRRTLNELERTDSGHARGHGKYHPIRRTWTLWVCRHCGRDTWIPMQLKNDENNWINVNPRQSRMKWTCVK